MQTLDFSSLRIPPTSSSPEPPPPPPRNHDPSFNDSKDSNEISEAECDRDQLINSRTYGGNAAYWMFRKHMIKMVSRHFWAVKRCFRGAKATCGTPLKMQASQEEILANDGLKTGKTH
ncbi:hypothetical protein YQE_07589, partial [Dendroctonus ponderosae]